MARVGRALHRDSKLSQPRAASRAVAHLPGDRRYGLVAAVQYDRTVLAYHGCDVAIAERLLTGEMFAPSANAWDWLGTGIYFWEYGVDRALQFAEDQRRRGRVGTPAVVGAVLQLG